MVLGKILPVIGFGLTIVVGGIYWVTWDLCREYLDSLILDDIYYVLMRHIWAWIPAILLIVAVMCLIIAGTSSREHKEAY